MHIIRTYRLPIALLAVALTVIIICFVAADAEATTFTGDRAPEAQAITDAAQLPTPNRSIELVIAPCPQLEDTALACAYVGVDRIYLRDADQLNGRVLYHELGHTVWTSMLNSVERAEFIEQVTIVGNLALTEEWFAEAYADCALDPVTQRVGWHAYGYQLDPALHSRVCDWMRVALAQDTPPAPLPEQVEPPAVEVQAYTYKRVCRKVTVRKRVRRGGKVRTLRKVTRRCKEVAVPR
jgi:hypothetical protein